MIGKFSPRRQGTAPEIEAAALFDAEALAVRLRGSITELAATGA
jgi:hypothetical protein